jgi:4-amino-4-deoxy-L-arabinose transferase-like glycosyltransferase
MMGPKIGRGAARFDHSSSPPAGSGGEENRVSRRHSRRIPLLLAGLLLVGYYVMAVSASWTKSPTFDEIVHITAGYNAWTNHDQRFDPGNGDFVKRWATLPLLISRPKFPEQTGDDWRAAEFFRVSREFMFGLGNDPDAILRQTRGMVALLGVALGALVFVCSRRLFGDRGGLISATLFAFSPHMLAHGALVSTDLALTLMLLASTWFAWRLLHVVTWPNLIGSLAAFSLLVISKMSAVLIVPIAGVLIIARAFHREPWAWRLGAPRTLAGRGRQGLALASLVAVHALAGWIAIWAVFEFKYVARADVAQTELALMHTPGTEVGGLINEIAGFCHQHHLLPEGFLKGMEELVGISQRRPSFMNGHWKAGGRAAFFPYAFWAKTSPALLVLALAGVVAIVGGARRARDANATAEARAPGVQTDRSAARSGRDILYEAIPFFALFVIYAAVAVRQGVNIGHRHILPLYPVLYILAGGVVRWFPTRKRWAEIAVAVLIGGFIFDSLAVRPDYLAYFSPVVGGPSQGYRRLADSSLDWGQDLPGLKRWLDAHDGDAREPVFFSYFGTGDPAHYGIEANRLPGFPEWRELRVFAYTPGYYAISATLFQQLYTTTFGPWNRLYEDEYQVRAKRLGLTEENTKDTAALGDALQALPPEVWQQNYSRYERLRFGRLCAWLRATGRVPTAEVGYSILVWRLDANDLHAALWGKPLELYEAPASSVADGI